MASSKYHLVVHGGTCDLSNLKGENIQRKAQFNEVLQKIADKFGSQLAEGREAIDVVQGVVAELEDNALFNAGKGAAPTRDEINELEAAIIDGSTGAYGAVACADDIKNPIYTARHLLENRQHVLLVGQAANEYARPPRRQASRPVGHKTPPWEHFLKQVANKAPLPLNELEAVGAIALDIYGNLAAAGSSGGMTCKAKGSISHTAIVGAGLYADRNIAIVCTGVGHGILRRSVAARIALLHESLTLKNAVEQTIDSMRDDPTPCAVIALSADGTTEIQSSGRIFFTASSCHTDFKSRGKGKCLDSPDDAKSVLPQHYIFQDSDISAGLTRYPITPGHVLISYRWDIDIMSLDLPSFLTLLMGTRKVAAATSYIYRAQCGMITDGGKTISLVPLHGVSGKWTALAYNTKEPYDSFPGYVTTKGASRASEQVMRITLRQIEPITCIQKPYNWTFNGNPQENGLFARIIRGGVSQWRIWENHAHIAILTPFGGTLGTTLIIPRKPLSNDVFSLPDEDFVSLIEAAHEVSQCLKAAFNVTRVGMAFEGWEGDWSHVRLIPILDHRGSSAQGQYYSSQKSHGGSSVEGHGGSEEDFDASEDKVMLHVPTAEFTHQFRGWLTSQPGPPATDINGITSYARRINERYVHMFAPSEEPDCEEELTKSSSQSLKNDETPPDESQCAHDNAMAKPALLLSTPKHLQTEVKEEPVMPNSSTKTIYQKHAIVSKTRLDRKPYQKVRRVVATPRTTSERPHGVFEHPTTPPGNSEQANDTTKQDSALPDSLPQMDLQKHRVKLTLIMDPVKLTSGDDVSKAVVSTTTHTMESPCDEVQKEPTTLEDTSEQAHDVIKTVAAVSPNASEHDRQETQPETIVPQGPPQSSHHENAPKSIPEAPPANKEPNGQGKATVTFEIPENHVNMVDEIPAMSETTSQVVRKQNIMSVGIPGALAEKTTNMKGRGKNKFNKQKSKNEPGTNGESEVKNHIEMANGPEIKNRPEWKGGPEGRKMHGFNNEQGFKGETRSKRECSFKNPPAVKYEPGMNYESEMKHENTIKNGAAIQNVPTPPGGPRGGHPTNNVRSPFVLRGAHPSYDIRSSAVHQGAHFNYEGRSPPMAQHGYLNNKLPPKLAPRSAHYYNNPRFGFAAQRANFSNNDPSRPVPQSPYSQNDVRSSLPPQQPRCSSLDAPLSPGAQMFPYLKNDVRSELAQ
ncbi:MAG: hypothetical protein MMC33_006685 [Icmadophila ericetorum]|nr:hypothetical protein [Icmadophila ericetorum]